MHVCGVCMVWVCVYGVWVFVYVCGYVYGVGVCVWCVGVCVYGVWVFVYLCGCVYGVCGVCMVWGCVYGVWVFVYVCGYVYGVGVCVWCVGVCMCVGMCVVWVCCMLWECVYGVGVCVWFVGVCVCVWVCVCVCGVCVCVCVCVCGWMQSEGYKRKVDTGDEMLAQFIHVAAGTKETRRSTQTNNTRPSHAVCKLH